jgi:bloom syndrome protein
VGEEALYDAFSAFLATKRRSPESMRRTDADVSLFVDWFFQQGDEDDDGAGDLPGEADDDDDPAPQGRAWARPADVSDSGDEYLSDEDVQDEGMPDAVVEVVELGDTEDEEDGGGGGGGGSLGDPFLDDIECSSEEEEAGAGGSASAVAGPSRRVSLLARGGAQGPAAGLARFFPALPTSPPPSASPRRRPPPGAAQHAPSAAMRPPTAEEAALDDLDFANRLVFGNAAFRPRQRDIVAAALAGRDCFVLMPTGGGKSLCYQLPAVLTRGVTVVVTPLLSLMQDQVQALCGLPGGGVPATYLSSQQTAAEAAAVHRELAKPLPSFKLLYVTPEQLAAGQRLRAALAGLDRRGLLARVVVDEAHCVSAWGHGAPCRRLLLLLLLAPSCCCFCAREGRAGAGCSWVQLGGAAALFAAGGHHAAQLWLAGWGGGGELTASSQRAIFPPPRVCAQTSGPTTSAWALSAPPTSRAHP